MIYMTNSYISINVVGSKLQAYATRLQYIWAFKWMYLHNQQNLARIENKTQKQQLIYVIFFLVLPH